MKNQEQTEEVREWLRQINEMKTVKHSHMCPICQEDKACQVMRCKWGSIAVCFDCWLAQEKGAA